MNAPTDLPIQLLTTPQAAEVLGVTPDTLRRWRMKGFGPKYVRHMPTASNSPVLYAVRDLEAWIDAHTVDGSTGAASTETDEA